MSNAVLTSAANQNTSVVVTNANGTESYQTNGSVNSGNGQVTITWLTSGLPTPSLTSTPSPSVTVGGHISDSATLAGGSSPTGTITFNLYGPGDTSCQTALATSTATVSGDGTYTSASFTPTVAGTYEWIAAYGGDSANNPVPGTCGAGGESVIVTAASASPSLSTVASGSVQAGGQISDAATLSGGSSPTGTITFKLFGPGDTSCAIPLTSSAAAVSGDGVYYSASFAAATAGTYMWVASYGGDTANSPASDPCGATGESVVVAAPATSSVCGTNGVLSGAAALTCTYNAVGSDTFTVPTGVTQARFSVVGAMGGRYYITGDPAHGGSPAGDIVGLPSAGGGQVIATLGLTPGQTLQVDVAGAGGNGTAASRSGGTNNGPSGGSGAPGGFGGSSGGVAGAAGDASGAAGGTAADGGNGSGGGGSSDVRIAAGGCAARSCSLSARLLVGAGGGGGGGVGGSGNALGGAGGAGGGSVGADGGSTIQGGAPGASGAGAASGAGGAGALYPGLPGGNTSNPAYGDNGAGGLSGAGGAGGGGDTTTPNGGAGGGGGGGLFGGGGGSGGGSPSGGGAGGGGGGGGSFAAAVATSVAMNTGVNAGSINAGNGQVTISWGGGSLASPSLSATASPSVFVGSLLTDSARLSGGSSPSGAITFRLFGPSDPRCTARLASSIAAVAGDGTYRSAAVTPRTAGTYRWVASYGGDHANNPAGTACDAAGQSVVVKVLPRINVLAASPLAAAFRKIDRAEEYSLADSDVLARLLARGARGDVFAGADDAAFRSLVRHRQLGRPVAIATTQLVLIVPPRRTGHVTRVSALKRPGMRFLIADAGLSRGAMTRSVLSRLHLDAALAHATSTFDTPGQMVAEVAAGRVDAAFVYACDLTRATRRTVRVVSIPTAGRATVTFEAAVVRRTHHRVAATAYMTAVLSPIGQHALRQSGFGKP